MAGFGGNDLRFTKHMSLDGSTRHSQKLCEVNLMTGHTLILNKQTGDTLKTILRSNVLIRKMRVKHIKISNYRLFIFQMFTGSKI